MHKKVDRARLFLSFDALKGFKDYVKTNLMNLTGKFIKFKKEMK